MVVHGGHRQQRRDRRLGVIGVPVGDDQRAGALRDRVAGADAQVLQRVGKPLAATFDVVERPQHRRLEPGCSPSSLMWTILFSSSLSSTGQLQHDLTAGRRGRFEQVVLGAHHPRHRGDDLFADGVQGRVGHLGEEFDEVVVEQPRSLRQHRGRRVGSHRAQRFRARGRHRREHDPQLLLGVSEGDLPAHHGIVVGLHAHPVRQRLRGPAGRSAATRRTPRRRPAPP